MWPEFSILTVYDHIGDTNSMNAFDKRKKGMETKLAVDDETRFKIQVKTNRLLGEWVARKLGLEGAAIDAYAKDVIKADFEEVGHEDLFRKIMQDVGDRIPESEIRQKARELHEAVRTETLPKD